MKLDFNKQFINLEEKEIPGNTMGQLLASALVGQTKGNVLKFFEWGMKLYKGETIDLDTADQKLLKEFIETTDNLAILYKGQLLQVFEKKEESKQNLD